MRKICTAFILFLVVLLGGCETFYGPNIRNGTLTEIEVRVTYAGGAQVYTQLSRGADIMSGRRGLIPIQIDIVYAGSRFYFSKTQIDSLLSKLNPSERIVIVFDGNDLRGQMLDDKVHK